MIISLQDAPPQDPRQTIVATRKETAPVGAAIGLLAETESEIEEAKNKAASKSSSVPPVVPSPPPATSSSAPAISQFPVLLSFSFSEILSSRCCCPELLTFMDLAGVFGATSGGVGRLTLKNAGGLTSMLELPPTQAVEILHFTDSSSYSQRNHSRNRSKTEASPVRLLLRARNLLTPTLDRVKTEPGLYITFPKLFSLAFVGEWSRRLDLGKGVKWRRF
ncbi:hypothetical protein Bca52824_082679 [Brassica carinata]|uniref:Uncharacterized protein n=1 Tax=Brassica carinata TaxID=52824 RepID=A0A8X7PKS3_BRACI|nr:hypothetical protein Bca52824_082679 [Brassica carinata]